MKRIEFDLQYEYEKVLKEKGEIYVEEKAKPAFNMDKINKEFNKKISDIETRNADIEKNMANNAQLLVMHERKLREEEIKKAKEKGDEDYRANDQEFDDGDLSWLDQFKENKERIPLKWTPKLETQLEDTLIRNNFDFSLAANAFMKIINAE